MPLESTTALCQGTGSGMPDAALLRAWLKDQRQADSTEIVRRHLGLVRGIARSHQGVDPADDTAQVVCAILARKAAALSQVVSLRAWLHRVTLLQCRNALRSKNPERRNHQAAMEYAELTGARDPLAGALTHLDRAITALPETDREVVLLRYSEGLTFPEVAQRSGR